MIKTCPICGKTFKTANWNSNKVYCSRECVRISQFKEKLVKRCEVCGKIFEVKPCRENAKFCSRSCFKKSRIGLKRGNEIIKCKNYAKLIITSDIYGVIEFLIDIEDINLVKNFTWCLTHSRRSNFYAMTKNNDKSIKLHRYLMNCPDDMEVDHINHNTLDNRKENLRICKSILNKQNLGIRKNQKNYKYIYASKYHNGYNVLIQRNNIYFSKHCLSIEEALSIRNNFLKNNYKNLNITEFTLNEILTQS